jgi:putative tryptophan/tyrosine transport system substrate-binding protein
VRHELPSIQARGDAASRGSLMADDANRVALHQRAAWYVARILKRTNPADPPIELPNQFDSAVNLKTARAIGLAIPQSVLAQATELVPPSVLAQATELIQ